jgi:hypothetical protein
VAYKIQTAIKARVPIVTCTTRDVANLVAVLQHMFPNNIVQQFVNPDMAMKEGTIAYAVNAAVTNSTDGAMLRQKFQKAKSTLLLVNPAPNHDDNISMSTGLLPVPRELLAKMLQITNPETLKHAMAALGGLTIREAYETATFSMAETGALTPAGLAKARSELFKPQKGLYPVDTLQDFYKPSPEIEEWVEDERDFFLTATDKRLIPRGLMLDGRPGTGKTEAAKYIARNFNVPLYRLDLATTQDKYVGNSAKFLQANLDTIDQQEPCVVLIDEVEKVVNVKLTYTTELLSMLLYWMQTHTSKVLVICTTNDLDSVPAEFYRPGRIDQVFNIEGVKQEHLADFVTSVLQAYGHADDEFLHTKIMSLLKTKHGGNLIAPAEIENETRKLIKKLAKTKTTKADVAPGKKVVQFLKPLVKK